MRAELRTVDLKSWLDPSSSRRLATELSLLLQQRFSDRKGLFLSLTYDRAGYSNPLALYRASGDSRHVRRFMARLGRWLWDRMPAGERPRTSAGRWKNPLAGRWLCKLEFQMGGGEGWPHWHICIVWPDRIPQAVIQRLWGHGIADIRRITPERCRYVAKYIAKADDVPAWLLADRPRATKIVRTSPGFWHGIKEPRVCEATFRKPPPSAYVPIGQRLEEARTTIVVRCPLVRRWRIIRGLTEATCRDLLRRDGAEVAPVADSRWWTIAKPFDTVVALLAEHGDGGGAARPGASARTRAVGRAAEPPLHLIRESKPPRDPDGPLGDRPEWLLRYFEQTGACRWADAVTGEECFV